MSEAGQQLHRESGIEKGERENHLVNRHKTRLMDEVKQYTDTNTQRLEAKTLSRGMQEEDFGKLQLPIRNDKTEETRPHASIVRERVALSHETDLAMRMAKKMDLSVMQELQKETDKKFLQGDIDLDTYWPVESKFANHRTGKKRGVDS